MKASAFLAAQHLNLPNSKVPSCLGLQHCSSAQMPSNVFIIGAQCTGKTTLVLELERLFSKDSSSEHPQPAFIHEVARTVMSSQNFTSNDFGMKRWIDLQQCIAKAQIEAEESVRGQWFISDRSVIDPVIYAELQPAFPNSITDTKGWQASVQRMRDGVVVLCQAGQEAWLSSDAVRLAVGNVREWEALDGQFKALLQRQGIPYPLLSKDAVSIEERAAFVLGRLLPRNS